MYYAIANAAAFTQPAANHRWPRSLNMLEPDHPTQIGGQHEDADQPIGSVIVPIGDADVGSPGRFGQLLQAASPVRGGDQA